IFNADGTAQTERFVSDYTPTSIHSFKNLLSVTTQSNGDFVIAWASFDEDGSGMGIYQSLFRSDATYGTAAADTVNGTTGDDLLFGLAGADLLDGGAGKDGLEGGAGNDTLNGDGGADTMTGGQGDDVYFVNDVADVVLEEVGQGNDTVFSTVSFTLGTGVEALVLQGSNVVNGKGNTLNNTLTGNAGVNILTGGLGDDTYFVQNAGDKVVELSGEGNDVIFSSVSYSLAGINAEVLALTGAANLTATGNSLANSLVGNSGHNLLDAGAGTDTLTGGLGDDTFVV
ncbi:calcium-binding protein, partial [Asticcacaulis sp. YBE204]|uniref:calcium-binding protein n=2 Tax=unclassified Asticcacaulis TaxID=2628350 RepID=UPI0003C407A2